LKSELEGLKSLTGKDGQEALTNLNKEKSDLLLKYNALLAENRNRCRKTAAFLLSQDSGGRCGVRNSGDDSPCTKDGTGSIAERQNDKSDTEGRLRYR
jgi:hypothetical protein